ncbi:hypothetical protein [Haloferax sp. YSMS24]|uniref:hypothetical protein n=1 Tax=unclassified Haloferax TaxID=2625095 RepID=UPI00398CDA94
MSSNFTIRLYVDSTSAGDLLTSIAAGIQSHGWTYDEIYPGMYTINEEFDYATTDDGLEPDAGSLEDGIQTVAGVGVGSICLSQELEGSIRGLRIFLRNPEFVTPEDGSDPGSVRAVDLVTSFRYVLAHESVMLHFLELLVTLVRDIDPELAFAGSEFKIPYVTHTELQTAPVRIAPCTYFGPTASDYMGRDHLVSAPARLVKYVSDGILLVACPTYAGGCYEVEDSIAEHLGVEFFDEW